jgi:hypothetical protein
MIAFDSRAARLALLGVTLSLAAQAETLLHKRRLGNNTEGMTYAQNGLYADKALAIDGNDVISIALAGTAHAKVFDVLGLDPLARTPRGIVYSPSTMLFYFSSKFSAAATQLFVSDALGNAQPPLNLVGLDATNWSNWEGMSWVPADAPAFPNTIAALGFRVSDSSTHLFFIDPLSGNVLGEAPPQAGTAVDTYLCGVQYWPAQPGTFLVSDCGGSNVWAIDATGALLGDPGTPLINLPEAGDIESIVVRGNGQLYLNGYETGHLYAFDANLARTPAADRNFRIGLGVSASRMTWNYDTKELVVTTRASSKLYALPQSLASARLLFDTATANGEVPSATGIGYLGAGRLAIGNRYFPRGVDIADISTGASLSRLVLNCCESDPDPFPTGRPFQVIGVGANGTSTLLLSVTGDNNNFRVVTLAGTPETGNYPDGVRPTRLADVPLSSPWTGLDAQLFDAGEGPHIFTGSEIYDVQGKLTHTVETVALGITDGIVGGTWLGGNKFAIEDGDTSTVIVFSIP